MEPRARAGKNVGKMNFTHNERMAALPLPAQALSRGSETPFVRTVH